MRPQSDATKRAHTRAAADPDWRHQGVTAPCNFSPRNVAVLPVVGTVVAAGSASGFQDVLCVLGRVVTKMGEIDKIGE